MAKSYADYDPERLYLYAGLDTYVTSKMLKGLQPHIFHKPTLKSGQVVPSIASVYEEVVTPAFEFILDLEYNGIKYDSAGNRELNAKLEGEIGALREAIAPKVGDINLDSGPQLSDLLYNIHGFPVLAHTQSGAPSTDGDALKALAKETGEGWLNDLAKLGDLSSIRNTFVANYVKDFVKSDGRIHPTYNLHGTGSFRISGEAPNLTQLPRPKHGYNIRTLYGVPKGHTFLAFDYSSAEVKVLANICKDELLLKALGDGLDPHTFSASKMFGISYEDMRGVLGDEDHPLYKDYKNKRQMAKAVTFGIKQGSSLQ